MTFRPPRRGRTPNRAGAVAFVFCVASGSFQLWIVFTNAELQGGFPLRPADVNQVIGRILFGVCALIGFGVAALAAHDLRPIRDPDATPRR